MPYAKEFPEDILTCSYFKDIPEHFVLCSDFAKLYRLKKRKRVETKDNLEIRTGMDVIIHDPQAKKYFYRTLQDYTDMNKMLKYFQDNNLYILKDELRTVDVIEEEKEDSITESSPSPVKPIDNDEVLLF